jgi:hypothetical protein
MDACVNGREGGFLDLLLAWCSKGAPNCCGFATFTLQKS